MIAWSGFTYMNNLNKQSHENCTLCSRLATSVMKFITLTCGCNQQWSLACSFLVNAGVVVILWSCVHSMNPTASLLSRQLVLFCGDKKLRSLLCKSKRCPVPLSKMLEEVWAYLQCPWSLYSWLNNTCWVEHMITESLLYFESRNSKPALRIALIISQQCLILGR